VTAWICLAVAAAAETPPADAPVRISADRLLADMDGRTAEFLGHVVAVQGDTEITAARLKVFYAQGAGGQESGPAAQGTIERIEASGEVVIHFEENVAHAERAVYTAADGLLVLTGDQARILSGPNTVAGGRITLHRQTRRITVEKAAGGGRVEAVFVSGDQGLP
jgi:lipopolysaccharide export system protein LptA